MTILLELILSIIACIDVPERVKRIRLTESFRQIYALVHLARILQL